MSRPPGISGDFSMDSHRIQHMCQNGADERKGRKRPHGFNGPPHEARIRRCGPPLRVDELPAAETGVGVGVESCAGFSVCRGPFWCSDPAAVYEALGSAAADQLSWTALRDGGNNTGVSDTVKAYCGDLEGMLARGGRYKRQLLVRGRKAEALLTLPQLERARRAVLASAARHVAAAAAPSAASSGEVQHPATGPVQQMASAQLPMVRLLTEQLIKYLPSDRWFAPHYDKDRRDKSHEPLDPKAFDGPGDMLCTLCLGCECTLRGH